MKVGTCCVWLSVDCRCQGRHLYSVYKKDTETWRHQMFCSMDVLLCEMFANLKSHYSSLWVNKAAKKLACGLRRIMLTPSHEMLIDSKSPWQQWSQISSLGQELAGDDGGNYTVVILELLWHCGGAALSSRESFCEIAPCGEWYEACTMHLSPFRIHQTIWTFCDNWLWLRQCVWLIPVLFSSYHHRWC